MRITPIITLSPSNAAEKKKVICTDVSHIEYYCSLAPIRDNQHAVLYCTVTLDGVPLPQLYRLTMLSLTIITVLQFSRLESR